MNEANETHLFTSYPLLYRDHEKKSLTNPLQFGFGCGDGWYSILDEFSAKAEKIIAEIQATGTRRKDLPRAVQIKEKFGELVIAMANARGTAIDDLASAARRTAAKTCMRCGAPGELRQGDYLATLCDNCHNEPRPQ